MMAARHYTKEELHNLRNSPLVQKPDDLPAIEQWLEYVYADPDSREKLRIPHSESQQSNATARRQAQGSKTGGDSPMGSFSTGVRPSLMGRGSARGGELLAYVLYACDVCTDWVVRDRRCLVRSTEDDVSIK
jgi:hypothetical protein